MQPIAIDIIILSYAKNERLKELTIQTINTVLASENHKRIKFNILVVESHKSLAPYNYAHTSTLYPDSEFGFNKYLNIGIKATSNNYVCLCNNDLVFEKNWATEILNLMAEYPSLQSVNPICPDFYATKKFINNQRSVFATRANIHLGILTGWCIFVKRDIFSKIGLLDEQFDFWYADKDYGMTLIKNKVIHALAVNSYVKHLGNQSHTAIDGALINNYTIEQKYKYDLKWNRKLTLLKKFLSFKK